MTSRIVDLRQTANGFALGIGGAELKTPAGAAFEVPTEALANAIADEWRAQGRKIDAASMPLTQLAATSIDLTLNGRGPVVDGLAAYASSELLCHEAESPPSLVERQRHIWRPILNGFAERSGVRLLSGKGIMPIAQPPEALAALRTALEGYDGFRLTGLRQAAHASGSLVLALALAERQLDTQEVFAASVLDELFQIERWGQDPATEARHADLRRELSVYARWFGLLD